MFIFFFASEDARQKLQISRVSASNQNCIIIIYLIVNIMTFFKFIAKCNERFVLITASSRNKLSIVRRYFLSWGEKSAYHVTWYKTTHLFSCIFLNRWNLDNSSNNNVGLFWCFVGIFTKFQPITIVINTTEFDKTSFGQNQRG